MIPGSPATVAVRHLLTILAGTRHTGALHVGGTPGGTIYVLAGRVTYAESPASPGVGARLITSGRLAEQIWWAAYEAGQAERRVGSLLVQQGHLGQGELVCRVLAVICDATQAIVQGAAGPARFVRDEQHWLGPVTQLELTALARETTRRLLPHIPAENTPTPLAVRGNGDPVGWVSDDYATLKRIRRSLQSME